MENFFNNDPMLGTYKQEQTRLIEEIRRREVYQGGNPIWDKIDSELSSLTDAQRDIVLHDEDYQKAQQELATLVQTQLVNLVKPQIENSENGKKLLEKVYDATTLAKKKAVNETEKKLKIFEQFQLYSVKHPNTTYEEFVKTLNSKKK